MSDFDKLAAEVMANPAAKAAADENRLRREMGEIFLKAMREKKITVQSLADELEVGTPEIHRLVHMQVGGRLNLYTVVRAANYLGLTLKIEVSDDES